MKDSKIPYVFSFPGSATIRNVETLRVSLLETLNRHTAIALEFSEVTEADISLPQLVLAARKQAIGQGKTLALALPAAGALLDVLNRGGFLDPRSGSPDTDFWLSGVQAP